MSLVFSLDPAIKTASVFRSTLAAAVDVGATVFLLEDGDGEKLPALSSPDTLVLYFGSDTFGEEVVCTHHTLNSDYVTCQPLENIWPYGSAVSARVTPFMLASFAQGVGGAGATGATGQGYSWRGAYAAETAYLPYDSASFNGSSYVCILATTGNDPTNETYWSLTTSKGDAGATGAPGAAGAAGPTGDTQIAADLGVYGLLSIAETTVTFNDSTYLFTLAPTSATWNYYRAGVKHTITGSKTVTLPGTPPATGTWYVYIDATDGTLTASQTAWTLQDTKVLVQILEWNPALTPKYWLAEERHPPIQRHEHYYLHKNFGTLATLTTTISGLVAATDTLAAKRPSLSAALISDENLLISIPALTPAGTPWTSTPYNIIYRTGASAWAWHVSKVPFAYHATSLKIQYDNGGTLTETGDDKYVNWYLLQTDLVGGGFFWMPGQAAFKTLALARAENPALFALTNFPLGEFRMVKQAIWNREGNNYTTEGTCVWVEEHNVSVGPIISISQAAGGAAASTDIRLALAGETISPYCTTPLNVGSVWLNAATYQAPEADIGCASPAHAATLKLKQADGTVLATVGGTAGGVQWRHASAGFTLATGQYVDITLESNHATAIAVPRGLRIWQ